MTEPTHIKSSRLKATRTYHIELTERELDSQDSLTRIYEVEAGSFAEAELLALELWAEDEERAGG